MVGLNKYWPAMVFPALILVAGIYIFPAIQTLLFSFGRVDVVTFSVSHYVGLDNYVRAFQDPRFLDATLRTLYFGVVTVGMGILISFPIAVLLTHKFVGRSIVRVSVLLPWAVPQVVAGVMWEQMFHAEIGMVNSILRHLGIISRNVIWLGDATLALHVVMLAVVWRIIPFITLFLLAALQTIPHQLYEAADIDGANGWRRFRFITLPLTMPVLIPTALIQFVWTLKVFGEIFVLTGGGPSWGTTTLNYLVYRESFEFFRLDRGSAIAYVLLLLTLFVVLLGALARRFVSVDRTARRQRV